MGLLSSAWTSTKNCLEAIQFGTLRAGMRQQSVSMGIWGYKRDEKMLRLQTIAKLHENMFEIQVEIHQYKSTLKILQTAAEECVKQGGTDNDLMMWYKRIRATELQQNALAKSENIIRFTINGLESQGMMENMNRIISYTVKQHKMAQENGLLNSSQENLTESFEQVSNHVARSQEIIESLDSQSTDIQSENIYEPLQMDSGFAKWKSNLTSVSLMPEILTNNMQDNRANALSAL
jgi:hypothetical protein